jgi:membrane-associated phospholipid phosphatase
MRRSRFLFACGARTLRTRSLFMLSLTACMAVWPSKALFAFEATSDGASQHDAQTNLPEHLTHSPATDLSAYEHLRPDDERGTTRHDEHVLPPSIGDTRSPSPIPPRFRSLARYVDGYPRHVARTLAPLGDVRRDAMFLAGATALVVAAHQADSTAERWVLEGHTIGNGWDAFGSDWMPYVLIAGYLVPSLLQPNVRGETWRTASRIEALLETTATQALIIEGIKKTTDRLRPNGNHYAFPSGHTGLAFSTAALTDATFGHTAGAFAFAGAAYVGITRVTLHRHWLSDVVAGAAIGTAVGELVGREHRLEERGLGVHAIRLKDGSFGLAFTVPLNR